MSSPKRQRCCGRRTSFLFSFAASSSSAVSLCRRFWAHGVENRPIYHASSRRCLLPSVSKNVEIRVMRSLRLPSTELFDFWSDCPLRQRNTNGTKKLDPVVENLFLGRIQKLLSCMGIEAWFGSPMVSPIDCCIEVDQFEFTTHMCNRAVLSFTDTSYCFLDSSFMVSKFESLSTINSRFGHSRL